MYTYTNVNLTKSVWAVVTRDSAGIPTHVRSALDGQPRRVRVELRRGVIASEPMQWML